MDSPYSKKLFAIASGIVFVFEVLLEVWQRKTGYIINDKPLLFRLLIEPALVAGGLCIIYWVWPKKKK